MKIGILTQPLQSNYGGVLQAYALQTVLKRMGHNPYIIQRKWDTPLDVVIKMKLLNLFKLLKSIFIKSNNNSNLYPTSSFIKQEIAPKSKEVYSTFMLKIECHRLSIKTFIVGSDQVWRPQYSPCIENYFLDFVSSQTNVKRIAYAASFGVDNWEFTNEQTKKCSKLVQKFDTISVREASGITLCKEHFGVDAVHVLDPTLLLLQDDYKKLYQKQSDNTDGVLVYILDENYQKKQIIETVSEDLNLRVNVAGKNQTVYEWLSSFEKCKYVITDSFHGCVFSIIFNKPFWVIPNNKRGLSRIISLLEMLGLEKRMITVNKKVSFNESIDWDSVNKLLNTLRQESMSFLKKSLE